LLGLPFVATAATPIPGAAARAPRYFSQTQYQFSTGYTETDMQFDLPFTNNTGRPLKALSAQTSCSCLKATVPQTVLQPGETGLVRCSFHMPNAVGPVQKALILKTDAKENATEVVMVRLDVPGLLHCAPERLAWVSGGPADEKTVKITVAEGNSLRLTGLDCSRDVFTWSLKTLSDGHEYELTVKPKDTSRPVAGMFLIATDSPVPRQKLQSLHWVIEPETVSPAAPAPAAKLP
jgi:hypothetical protein